MYAVYGSALTAGAILAVALLALLFANPSAPRWTQRELTAQLASVAVTIPLGLGLGLLALSPSQMMAEGVTLPGLAALVCGVALVVLTLRALKIGARRRADQATPAADVALAAAEPPQP
jgi:hypothetical protein